MSMEAIPSVNDTTPTGFPLITDSTERDISITIILLDLSGIDSFHIKLGTSDGTSNLLLTTFDYGVQGVFGNRSYSQTGNLVHLYLGSFVGPIFYSEVQVERTDHILENPVSYPNN